MQINVLLITNPTVSQMQKQKFLENSVENEEKNSFLGNHLTISFEPRTTLLSLPLIQRHFRPP